MKERLPETALLCAVLLLFAPRLFGLPGDVDRSHTSANFVQELIDLQKGFVSAKEQGDARSVKNTLADDFTAIGTTGNAVNKMDFVRDIHTPEQPGPAPILYDFKVLRLNESCAVVMYKAVFPGSQLEKYQQLSDTWVRDAEGWKLKFEQSTLSLWSAHDLD